MKFVCLADRPDAIPTIAKWYYNQWGYLQDVSSVEKTVQLLQYYLKHNELPLILLAIEQDEILGVVQIKYYEMDIYPQKEHWIGGVYVPAEHRGKTIAKSLVKKAIEVAKSHDVETLYLQTQKPDGGLYKKLGWKPVEKVKYRGEEVLVMKKEL